MDAEFSMHYGKEGVVPGKKIGQFDAKDVNWVSEQLAKLVAEKQASAEGARRAPVVRTEMVSHAGRSRSIRACRS